MTDTDIVREPLTTIRVTRPVCCDILESLALCIEKAQPFAEHERTRQALNRLIDATAEIIKSPASARCFAVARTTPEDLDP